MRIESSTINMASFSKTLNSTPPVFEKNQIVNGRILSIDNNGLDINFSGGFHVKASVEGNMQLPLNTSIDFEVLAHTGDKLLLRPLLENHPETVPKERILAGLAARLGIQPSQDNLNFLEKCENLISRNLEKMANMLLTEGKEDAVKVMQNIFTGPEKLADYLKDFKNVTIEKLIGQLDELYKEIKKDNLSSGAYNRLMGEIIKGLSVQVNHTFPLFFIPIPLVFNNRFYPGELWIEKDASNAEEGTKDILIYLMVDAPFSGRVEANIKHLNNYIYMDIYCNKSVLPLFDKNSDILKEKISRLGITLKSLMFHELKKNNSFFELSKKYVKPLPSLDIRI